VNLPSSGPHDAVPPRVPMITDGDIGDDPGATAAPLSASLPVPAPGPWERRQPRTDRRPVLPVEWFRRMPGGGTTYAPAGAEVTDGPAVTDGD
jgi:hypothetical protein